MGYQTPGFDVLTADPERVKAWCEILRTHQRVALAGGPRTGKSTLANVGIDDRPVFHSDDFKHLEWAEVPAAMVSGVADEATFVIEGVMVARALRKGLSVDALVVLDEAKLTRNGGQEAMAKAVSTILAGIDLGDLPIYRL